MEHLNEQQIQHLTRVLTERRNELRRDIRDELLRSDAEQYADLAGSVHDAAEESVADMLVDMNIARVSKSVRALREVEAALTRIEEGTYGICVDGEEEIPFARLEAQPTALRCITHQARHEQTHLTEQHPTI